AMNSLRGNRSRCSVASACNLIRSLAMRPQEAAASFVFRVLRLLDGACRQQSSFELVGPNLVVRAIVILVRAVISISTVVVGIPQRKARHAAGPPRRGPQAPANRTTIPAIGAITVVVAVMAVPAITRITVSMMIPFADTPALADTGHQLAAAHRRP